jgi:small subunit ribosomal protein S13
MRLLGVNIKTDKQLQYGLCALYGIGLSSAKKILSQADIPSYAKPVDLTESENNRLLLAISQWPLLELDLKRKKAGDIVNLKSNGCQRGIRLRKGLPVHGQRTHGQIVTARKLNRH